MNKLFIILLSFIFTDTNAATKTSNIQGEWKGQRFQFDETKSKYIAEFEYTYTLTQEGNQVKGVAKIAKDDAFAEIAVRGFIQDNKFYFEEYEVLNAKRREGFLWCLKKGVLDIHTSLGKTTISGATPSFMEVYGLECSGGVTMLAKNIETPSDEELRTISNGSDVEKSFHVGVFPNPFIESTNISFDLSKDESVNIDVIDIQGNIISTLENKVLNAGSYRYNFIPNENQQQSYFYIRLKIGDKTFSKSIQKAMFNGISR